LFKVYFKKYWAVGVLLVIILLTGFLRGWHLEEYALFRADQARDAYLAKDVFENGLSNFKLLGPKAGATVTVNEIKSSFKLGPVYHYLQYIGIILTRELSVIGLLLIDWILSLLSIFLFYFFIRSFFNKKISLVVTVLFAFSYLLTIYSRFAWNINQIIFWQLLGSISILKIINTEIQNRNKTNKVRGRWFFVLVLTLGIIGQLHILAAIAFGFMSLVMFLIYRPKINWKYWLGGIGIILVLYSPMVISDVYNQGDNFKRLLMASSVEKQAEGNLGEKIVKVSLYHGKNYTLILTGINKYDYKKISQVGDWFIVLSLILIRLALFRKRLLGISKLPKIFIRQVNKMFKLTSQQKQFLIIISLWFLAFFLIYFRILPRLHKERYWLMIAPLPFIFLAFWFYVLDRLGSGEFKFWNRYITNGIIVVVAGLILGSNLAATSVFYKSLAIGNLQSSKYHQRITVGPYRFFTGYGEMKDVVDFMVTNDSEKQAVCFKSMEYQNKLGFEYLLDMYHPETHYEQTSDGGKYNCNFYVITKTSREDRELRDFKAEYNIGKKSVFKSLTVWQLSLKESNIKKQEVRLNIKRSEDDGRIIYWKDVFK
jgi:4-amino-4-deoxy-L-arabinose transferase-like glycosyltransferase